MCEVRDEDVHSAVPSWNGFVYQGKIAIYTILDNLIEHHGEDLDNYSCEIEWLEDFSIKNADGEYISIHQVKCYQSRRFSSYKDAFWKLLAKADRYNIDTWLHVAQEIDDFPDQNDLIDNHQPTNEELELDDEITQNAWRLTKLYNYHTGNQSCDLDDLEDILLEKLNEFYELHYPEDPIRSGSDFFQRCLLKLYDLIENRLREIHSLIHKGSYNGEAQEIKFSDFIEILDETSHADSTKGYKIFKLKETLDLAYQKFNYYEDISSNQDNSNLTDKYYFLIKSLDKAQLVNFCISIDPSKIIKEGIPLINYQGIQLAFFNILKSITSCEAKLNESQLTYFKDNCRYLPLAIDSSPRNSSIIGSEILKRGMESSTVLNLLYHTDYFITQDITIESLKKLQKEERILKNVDYENLDERMDRRKIDEFENISIIDLNTAIEKLSND